MNPFLTHLESALDGTRLPANRLQTVHEGRPLWVRYNLAAVRLAMTKEKLRERPFTMWRYRELLPPGETSEIVSLGESVSPLLACPRLGRKLGLDDLWIKDESQLPTGSFKSRGMAMAVTMARQLGVTRIALPTAGNAGGAAAAYAARAGMECYVLMPDDTPAVNQYEAAAAGAKTFLVNGLIGDCGKLVEQGREALGWFNLATLREPYRIEGKKTMGLELAEQLGWHLPDVILYPTGGGTGLIGMWKAFAELRELGWLESEKLPRMIAVQSDGCCPIVSAFDKGERFARAHENARTAASGLRVPAALGDFMILDAIHASGGCAVSVEEERLGEWLRMAFASEGIPVCPEAAACVGAAAMLRERGSIQPNERVVIFNTGAAQKYVEVLAENLPRIDLAQPVDWQRLF